MVQVLLLTVVGPWMNLQGPATQKKGQKSGPRHVAFFLLRRLLEQHSAAAGLLLRNMTDNEAAISNTGK
jgi:hypothetical protein